MKHPSVDKMPTMFSFPLVGEIVRRTGISEKKARKAIQRGFVEVNGVIVRDPDLLTTGKDVVRVDKAVPIKNL